MVLFAVWSVLVLGALFVAGYSHYQYRETKNLYYEKLFAKGREEPVDPVLERAALRRRWALPVVTFAAMAALVPVSLLIPAS